MDAITHRHDDVAVPTNSGEVCRRVGREWEAVAPGGIDRAGVNARGGMRACGGDRDRTGARPDRCCQLRSGGVLGTDEQDPSRGRHQGRDEVLERLVHQGQVGAAFVGLGADSADQPGAFENLQVMGQQVGAHAERGAEYTG